MKITFLVIVAAVVVVAGCRDSSAPPSQAVEMGPLSFEVPAEWKRTDGSRPGSTMAVWTPVANQRKESVTVIRTRRPAPTRAAETSIASVQQQLVSAQASLREARISRVMPTTTTKGFDGSRIDLAYKPNGVERSYQRVHVVLVEDDTTLIHVLYTAAVTDEHVGALQLVLDTLRRKGDPS